MSLKTDDAASRDCCEYSGLWLNVSGRRRLEQTRVIVAHLRDRRKKLAAIKLFTASSNMCSNMRQKRVHQTIGCFNWEYVCFTAVSYLGSLRRNGSVRARWLWYERERARLGNLFVCYVFCVRKYSFLARRPLFCVEPA